MGPKTAAPSIEASRKNFGVVEDDEVAGSENVRDFAKIAVQERPLLGRKMKQAGGSAIGEGLLGDEFFRKIVVEIGDEHAKMIIEIRRRNARGKSA